MIARLWSKRKKPDPVAPVVNTVNEAQLVLNAISDLRTRIASAVSGGYDWADTLHNIFLDFGYPQTLTFANFWNMYRRFGIAKNAVELPVDYTWMRRPTVESDDKAFMRDFDRLQDNLSLWSRLTALDKFQRVGRYAGLFVRVRDALQPEKPIAGKLPGFAAIAQLVPLYEGQLEIVETETNPISDNYGMPTMYAFNGGGVGNRGDGTPSNFNIHPDRVIIAAEGADNGGVYGVPALEAAYNSLMDLRKILGGGGEGFYKNSAQNVVFNLKDPSSANSATTSLLEKFNEHYDDFARNRSRRGLWTPGMEAKTLESSLVNPKDFFFNSLYDVAASVKTPATILIGQQTGRLASDEDGRSFLTTINARRNNFGTDTVNSVIDWCIKWGALPSARYEVEWDDLLELSSSEQLSVATSMSKVNETQFRSGADEVFTSEEIREAAGYEPMEEIPPGSEELPEDEVDDGEKDS